MRDQPIEHSHPSRWEQLAKGLGSWPGDCWVPIAQGGAILDYLVVHHQPIT